MRRGFFLCFLFLPVFLVIACATGGKEQSAQSAAGDCRAGTEEQWGIKIVAVRLTEAGFLLDFRYKITDPEKAKPILGSSTKAYIIDQKSGIKVTVPSMPKVGSLRSSSREPLVGKQYFILFGNNVKFINPGDKVTVVIGDFRVEDLVVEK